MDAFVLARLATEAARAFGGAWVQGAWVDDRGRLVLRLRVPGRSAVLLLDPDPSRGGLGVVERRPPCPARPPALAAFLRAHAKGGRLVRIECLPYERVVQVDLEREDDGARVVLERVPPRGNLVVLDRDGMVRVAARRTGRVRPGAPYAPPPRPDGWVDPASVGPGEAAALWAGRAEPPRLVGFSPDLVREVSHQARAGGAWAAFRSVRDAYGTPGPLLRYGDRWSAVELAHRGEPDERVDQDLLAAAGRWLETATTRRDADADDRSEARRRRAFERRTRRRIERLRQDLERLPEPAELRAAADALAASLHAVVPGSRVARVTDPLRPDRFLEVDLDPALSPAANLDQLYRRARRAERAGEQVRDRIAEAEASLEAGPGPEPAPRKALAGPEGPYRRFTSSDGWPIWVGRNRVENDRLVREARPWDLWLHARGGAGAHVLVRKPGREARVPDRTVREAAGLAASYSSRSGDARVDVMVLEAGRLRRPRGGGPGRVLVAGEHTVRVRPGEGNPRPAPGGST